MAKPTDPRALLRTEYDRVASATAALQQDPMANSDDGQFALDRLLHARELLNEGCIALDAGESGPEPGCGYQDQLDAIRALSAKLEREDAHLLAHVFRNERLAASRLGFQGAIGMFRLEGLTREDVHRLVDFAVELDDAMKREGL